MLSESATSVPNALLSLFLRLVVANSLNPKELEFLLAVSGSLAHNRPRQSHYPSDVNVTSDWRIGIPEPSFWAPAIFHRRCKVQILSGLATLQAFAGSCTEPETVPKPFG